MIRGLQAESHGRNYLKPTKKQAGGLGESVSSHVKCAHSPDTASLQDRAKVLY